MSRNNLAPKAEVPGLAARRVAADILDGVLRRNRPLDEQLDDRQANHGIGLLSDRDRALARNIVSTTLRRLGTLRHLLGVMLEKGMPADAPRAESALLVGAAQILFLDVPDHAAVDLSVRIAQADRRAGHFSGLVNAVLRRITTEGAQRIAELDTAKLDTPTWLLDRWTKSYGAEIAHDIARANSQEPALDLTVPENAQDWATRLRGRVLPTGTVRMIAHGPVSLLPGFSEGAWWVQDAAAALPARLFGDIKDKRIADICAAPGGKTAQLAAAGAHVTAVDAPCSSTGTIRRHPDIAWLKRETDIAALADLQRRLLDRAVELVAPGGVIVYCTCSLETDEGEQQIADFLAREPRVRRKPIQSGEVAGLDSLLTPEGDLRSLPCHWPDEEARMGGLDGFYAARLERI